jgi:hypothetical protein
LGWSQRAARGPISERGSFRRSIEPFGDAITRNFARDSWLTNQSLSPTCPGCQAPLASWISLLLCPCRYPFAVHRPHLAMYRTALRSSPSALRAIRPITLSSASRRLVSTSAAAKKGTWKGTGLRWALAIGAVYFYNTSPIFADELPRTCSTRHLACIPADMAT